METKLSSRNAFEILCLWASRNNWCWKISCTTCGNQRFRIGLSLIAQNISFEEWDDGDRRRPVHLLPAPPRGRILLTESESKRLGRVLGNANLQAVRNDYKAHRTESTFAEDWLGYLGVGLERPFLVSEHKDKVAIAWRRQLDCMLGLPESMSKPITFAELEGYEERLSRATHGV